MDFLQNGVSVNFNDNKEQRSALVKLIDYEHVERNSFIVANQWIIVENSEKQPDVLVFINGLLVVVFELKSPSREETDTSEAFLQLRNYMHEIPSLFIYNAFLVMSDLVISKAGMITAGEDRFMGMPPVKPIWKSSKSCNKLPLEFKFGGDVWDAKDGVVNIGNRSCRNIRIAALTIDNVRKIAHI